MKNKVNTFKLSLILVALFFFLILPSLPNSLATNQTHEIKTFEDLMNYANLSRQTGYNEDTYILTNDIVITEENQKTLESQSIKYITFGSSEIPFKGIFDGNGYRISNLKYDANAAAISDTALFTNTDSGAVIRNLVIENASIDADYRGGIIAGYSKGTTFENIIINNSKLSISASNNVLSLITDGGIRGGAIVGEAEDSILYNCESNNTTVITNNTMGVAALSGKGLTLGALVGISSNTLIEYSRVYDGLVKIYYDVAVGALGGNTLYVGGIAGRIKNSSQIIDSFSTAELYYYCATYVSVGAGNSGHIGGITAVMEGTSNEIIRSHYAGKATSSQYNAVLVIPIIQNNVNISGIANIYDGGSVVNTYFKPSINSDVKMNVLGNSTSTSSYGPISDEKYQDEDFWQEKFYDLYGNIKRSSKYNDKHYNKWVIDKNKNIPIHGKTVSATLDFKNAGKVSILETELIKSSVSTANPYKFAVQGLKPSEFRINLKAEENNGYRFVGWYKMPNVTAWQLEESHEYFTEIFNNNEIISTEKEYNNVSTDNNNLFVGRYKASVIFHDIKGNIINTNGEVINEITDDDWYNYEDNLPDVKPINEPTSENAKLIGWTTIKSNESGGGYSSITSNQLANLKSNNNFYETNDNITKTLNLYPVYIDLISNVITVFEGNEQDNIDNISIRENVGETFVSLDENDNVVLSVKGTTNEQFPLGYRFLGWYNEEGLRISEHTTHIVKDIDLTKQNTFTARFEYAVEYYVRAFAQDDGQKFTDSELYTTKWYRYEEELENIKGPAYLREHITHWGTEHINHGTSDNTSDNYVTIIISPIKVYSHNYTTATGGGTTYQVYTDTDFPNSGTIFDEKATAGAKFKFTPTDENRYHLLFWTLERNKTPWSYVKNPMDTGTLDPSVTYKARAHVITDIIFHSKTDELTVVQRRYNSNILLEENLEHTYKYPFMHTETEVSTDPEDGSSLENKITLEKSPSDESMKLEGYSFLGWISSADVEKDSDEWNLIYDVKDDKYTTSNINKAKAYLITEDDLVTETQDLYPVYARYNVITKTNVEHGHLSDDINTPSDPTYTLEEVEKGYAYVALTPYLDTYVIGNDGVKYILLSVTKINEDGTKEYIEISEDNTYKYKIEAGQTYTFVANYDPLILLYHLNDTDIETVIKYSGEEVGTSPNPTYDLSLFSDAHLFVGYTKEKPTNGYHKFDTYEEYENSDINVITSSNLVNNSMELWPVYVTSNIKINSNIDEYLTENQKELTKIRTYQREDIDNFKLIVKEEKIENYYFIGWYTNYTDINNLGELITESKEFVLDKESSINNQTYTAVYKKVYDINYYDRNGNLLYSVKVAEDEPRSFVNKVINNNEEILTPIDYEAFESINETILPNESFNSWQWIKDNDEIVKWNDFKEETISSNMNLYPVINKVIVKDNNNNDLNVSDKTSLDLIIGYKNQDVFACFDIIYEQPKMTIHIEENAYNKTGVETTPIENMNVTVYPTTQLENEIGEEKTNTTGNAIFKFMGTLKISKESNNGKDAFIYHIYNKSNLSKKILSIVLKQNEEITINLPYSDYLVLEDNIWAWRYDSNYIGNTNINNKTNADVIFDNNKGNTKWFYDMKYIKNKY